MLYPEYALLNRINDNIVIIETIPEGSIYYTAVNLIYTVHVHPRKI